MAQEPEIQIGQITLKPQVQNQDLFLIASPDGKVWRGKVSDVVEAATAMVESSGTVAQQITQAQEILAQTVNAKNEALSEYEDKGPYNAATNSPSLSADASVGQTGEKQQKYTVTVEGAVSFAGSNFLSGATLHVGDTLTQSLADQWYRTPASDLSLKEVQKLQNIVTGNVFEDFVFPILSLSDELLAAWDKDGGMWVPYFRRGSIDQGALGELEIAYDSIADDAKEFMLKPLDEATGYAWAIVDENDFAWMMGGRDGKVEIPFLSSLPVSSVGMETLKPEVAALVTTGGVVNLNDRVITDDDDNIRAKTVPIQVVTGYSDYTNGNPPGSFFFRFPKLKTPLLSGLNTTGTSLDFRLSNRLLIPAQKYTGTFDPTATTALVETNYIGTASSAPSTAGRVNGDYYVIITSIGDSVVINSATCYSGDIIIFSSGDWIRKQGPANNASSRIGQWWNITVAGTFDKVSYSVGDIIYLGDIFSDGSRGKARYYRKLKKDEFAFHSSQNPNTWSGAIPLSLENVIYSCSVGGSFDSKNYLKDDYILRLNSLWHKIECSPVKTFLAGQFISLPANNADDWECRRTDGLNTMNDVITIGLSGRSGFQNKNTGSTIRIIGDSMTAAFLSSFADYMAPREVVRNTMAGGTPRDIYSMAVRDIEVNGDPHKGRFHVWYHGQNRLAETIEYAIKMSQISGARDAKFCFLSVLGSRTPVYNGSSFTFPTLEDAFAGTGSIYEIEQFYENFCPGNYINMRKMALEAAASITLQDLSNPGKTIAQSASERGLTPYNWHFNYDSLAYPSNEYTFLGYWNSVSAPTVGVDKDYYLSYYNAGGTDHRGSIWARESGVWVRKGIDNIHVSGSAPQLAANIKLKNFFTTNNF